MVKSDVPWWLWGLGALILSTRLYEKVQFGTFASDGFTCSRQARGDLSTELNASHGTYLALFTWLRLFGKGSWGCGDRDRGGFPMATTFSFSPVNKVVLLAKVFSCCYERKLRSRVSNQGTKSLHSLQRQLFHWGF